MKIAKVFTNEDNQSVWTYDTENGGQLHSVGVDVTEEGFSLVNGVPRVSVDRNIVWTSHNNLEVLKRQQQVMIDMLNAGKMRAYRAYSETPFYEGQSQDINPSTQESLGRYSQARMCLADDYLSVHKQFVVNTVATPAPVAQPKVGADKEDTGSPTGN
jgi:hypothetical protein